MIKKRLNITFIPLISFVSASAMICSSNIKVLKFSYESKSNFRVMIAIALATTIGVTPILLQQQSAFSVGGIGGGVQNDIKKTPIATSGNNLYMAWPNNDTGHWNVFFAKSSDGGKTLKSMMISAPNKRNVVHENTQISALGSNVYVTWWTNKTGVLMPAF